MAKVKLKNVNGQEVLYDNVYSIKLKDENDNDVTFRKDLFQTTTFMGTSSEVYAYQQTQEGFATTIPVEPTRSGYIFKGWSTVSHEFVPANKEVLPKVYLTSTILKAMWIELPTGSALIQKLGSATVGEGGVTFTVDASVTQVLQDMVNGLYDETDVYGNIFVKFPTFYRKVNVVEEDQITYMTGSFTQHDNTYEPYSCFVYNGNILPYILIGKYCFTSTTSAASVSGTAVITTLNNARALARALGTGYQLYDWQMQRLFQDLAMIFKQTTNVNANPLLGIYHLDGDVWIDGIARNNAQWLCAYNPANYVDSPTSSTTGYNLVGYSAPTTSEETIKKLGYDSNNPFFNYPSELTGERAYNSYYFDAYYYSGGNRPVDSYVNFSGAAGGLFVCGTYNGWTDSARVRLCYRPIA